MQASVLPRPDLLALGITYRRIPVVAFDNAIYVDTALQLDDLEARFPLKAGERGEGGSLVGCDRADVVRWRQWSRGLTIYAVGCLPSDLPALNDETMIKDRADLTGSTVCVCGSCAVRCAAWRGMANMCVCVCSGFRQRYWRAIAVRAWRAWRKASGRWRRCSRTGAHGSLANVSRWPTSMVCPLLSP